MKKYKHLVLQANDEFLFLKNDSSYAPKQVSVYGERLLSLNEYRFWTVSDHRVICQDKKMSPVQLIGLFTDEMARIEMEEERKEKTTIGVDPGRGDEAVYATMAIPSGIMGKTIAEVNKEFNKRLKEKPIINFDFGKAEKSIPATMSIPRGIMDKTIAETKKRLEDTLTFEKIKKANEDLSMKITGSDLYDTKEIEKITKSHLFKWFDIDEDDELEPVIDDQGRKRLPVTRILMDDPDCVKGPISVTKTLRNGDD